MGHLLYHFGKGDDTFVGQLQVEKNYAFLITESRSLATDIFVPKTALKGGKTGDKALVQIAAIYKAEEALKAEERYDRRQREVKPLVEAYFVWVHEQDSATILSQKTRDGLNYSINQEKYLKVFLVDGNNPIDNSV